MTRNEAKDRVVDALEARAEAELQMRDGDVPAARRWRHEAVAGAYRDAALLVRRGFDSTPDSEGGWRPIDDLAKDGNYWLVGWFDEPGQDSMAVAFWHSTHRAWCNTYTLFTNDKNWQPTHYRQLPAPPSQEQKP